MDAAVGRKIAFVALIAALAWFPINREFGIVWVPGYPDLQHRASFFLFDLPLAVLAVASVAYLAREVLQRRLGITLTLFLVLVALTIVSASIDPSIRGLQAELRLLGAFFIAFAVSRVAEGTPRTLALLCLGGAGALEAALGLSQVLNEQTLGLIHLGEHPPLLRFGSELAPKGTFVHPYSLAGFSLIASMASAAAFVRTAARTWLVLAAFSAVPLGLTYSRAGLAAVLVALAPLLFAAILRRGRYLVVSVVLLVAIGVPAVATFDGWVSKAEKSTVADTDVAVAGRLTAMEDAAGFMFDEPFLGVGPGHYTLHLEKVLEDDPVRRAAYAQHSPEVLPVHNVILLFGAEVGLPAALVFVALLGALGWRSGKTGAGAVALWAAYLPFLMFDAFPYTNPQGLALTGVWIGVLELLYRQRADWPEELRAGSSTAGG